LDEKSGFHLREIETFQNVISHPIILQENMFILRTWYLKRFSDDRRTKWHTIL